MKQNLINIIHQEFIKCFPFIKNDIFFGFFKNLIVGIYPRNSYIYKNVFTSKNKKFEPFRIDIDDGLILYESVKNAIVKSENLNIEYNKYNLFKILEIDKDLKWKNIKKKKIKDALIDDFVARSKKLYNLNSNQSKFLLFSIYISIVLKIIKHKDIHITDMKIDKINGIEFLDKDVIISKNIYNEIVVMIDNPKQVKNKMENSWINFMK